MAVRGWLPVLLVVGCGPGLAVDDEDVGVTAPGPVSGPEEDSDPQWDWGSRHQPPEPEGPLVCPVDSCSLRCAVTEEAAPLTNRFLEAADAAGFVERVYITEAQLIGIAKSKYYVAFQIFRDGMSAEFIADFAAEDGDVEDADEVFGDYFEGISTRWIEGDPIDTAAVQVAIGDCYGGFGEEYDPCVHNTEDMRVEMESEEWGACGRPLAILDLDPLTPASGCDLSPEESCGDD